MVSKRYTMKPFNENQQAHKRWRYTNDTNFNQLSTRFLTVLNILVLGKYTRVSIIIIRKTTFISERRQSYLMSMNMPKKRKSVVSIYLLSLIFSCHELL